MHRPSCVRFTCPSRCTRWCSLVLQLSAALLFSTHAMGAADRTSSQAPRSTGTTSAYAALSDFVSLGKHVEITQVKDTWTSRRTPHQSPLREYVDTVDQFVPWHATRLYASASDDGVSAGVSASPPRHAPATSFLFRALDQDVHVDLSLNHALFSPVFEVLHNVSDSERYALHHSASPQENCYYQGEVRGQEGSLVVMDTCGRGLRGYVQLGQARESIDGATSAFTTSSVASSPSLGSKHSAFYIYPAPVVHGDHEDPLHGNAALASLLQVNIVAVHSAVDQSHIGVHHIIQPATVVRPGPASMSQSSVSSSTAGAEPTPTSSPTCVELAEENQQVLASNRYAGSSQQQDDAQPISADHVEPRIKVQAAGDYLVEYVLFCSSSCFTRWISLGGMAPVAVPSRVVFASAYPLC